MLNEAQPRKPRQHPGNAEMEARVDTMIEVLSNVPGVTRYKLHRQFCEKWGCHWLTVDRVVIRARDDMMKRLDRTKREFRCEVLSHYKTVMDSREATWGDKAKAAQGVREMMGLDEPQKLQVDNRETVIVKHANELEFTRQ